MTEALQAESYMQKQGNRFLNSAHHPQVAKLFDMKLPVYKVLARETDEKSAEYWAWWNNSKKRFYNIYHDRRGVEMCSPDAYFSSEKAGEGKICPVEISQLEKMLA